MTLLLPPSSNATAGHFVPEDFRTMAHAELDVSTPWNAGVCFLPECGRVFTPRRKWQIYCCPSCEKAGNAEMRKWGKRMAMSALVWRMFKYDQVGTDTQALGRVARRHVTHVQSAWLADRQARAAKRGKS